MWRLDRDGVGRRLSPIERREGDDLGPGVPGRDGVWDISRPDTAVAVVVHNRGTPMPSRTKAAQSKGQLFRVVRRIAQPVNFEVVHGGVFPLFTGPG